MQVEHGATTSISGSPTLMQVEEVEVEGRRNWWNWVVEGNCCKLWSSRNN
jgi:hypothetical protein